MPVCPVCENPDVHGDACAVCGRELPRDGGAAADVAPLEGLEPTAHDRAPAAFDAFPELEPTRAAPVDAPAPVVDGLEPTAFAGDASDLALEPVEGLEPTAAEPVPGPAETGAVACRYCRTPVAGSEPFCTRCGMRLPSSRARARDVAPGRRTCGDCGATVVRDPCPACGARQAGG